MANEGGWIPAYRKLFEDPDPWLKPSKRVPASRVHAWLDLCQLAAWKETTVGGEQPVLVQRGEVVFSVSNGVDRWAWSPERVRRFLRRLESEAMITGGNETPHGRRYRIEKYDVYSVGESQARGGNETPNERGHERHKKKEKKEKKRPSVSTRAKPSSKRRSRATSYPDGFEPTAKHHELAEELRVDVEAELSAFRDWCLAKGQTYKDWDAAFRNWIRRAHEFGRTKSSDPGQGGFWQ